GYNQDFKQGATEWEGAFSNLLAPKLPWGSHPFADRNLRADPVVDSNFTIVGHYGWFRGDTIWVPNSALTVLGKGELRVELTFRDQVDMGFPVLVRYHSSRPADSKALSTDEQLYHLLTDVAGRVLLYDGYDIMGLQSAEQALLVIGILYSVGQLAVAGAKVGFRSLIRQFTKTEGKTLARPRFASTVISGQPPQVSVGQFATPGNLIGHVAIEEGHVVYRVKSIILRGAESAKEQEAVRVARLAHREMVMRAAEEAKARGLREFRIRGINANENFRKHARKLAEEIGVPGFTKASGTLYPRDFEVILDVAKTLAQ